MGTGEVPPGRDPPVRAEVVHESERTRVTRLFLPGARSSARSRWGRTRSGGCGMRLAMLERLRGVAGVAQLAEAPRYPGSIVLADAGGTSLAGLAKPLAG